MIGVASSGAALAGMPIVTWMLFCSPRAASTRKSAIDRHAWESATSGSAIGSEAPQVARAREVGAGAAERATRRGSGGEVTTTSTISICTRGAVVPAGAILRPRPAAAGLPRADRERKTP